MEFILIADEKRDSDLLDILVDNVEELKGRLKKVIRYSKKKKHPNEPVLLFDDIMITGEDEILEALLPREQKYISPEQSPKQERKQKTGLDVLQELKRKEEYARMNRSKKEGSSRKPEYNHEQEYDDESNGSLDKPESSRKRQKDEYDVDNIKNTKMANKSENIASALKRQRLPAGKEITDDMLAGLL